MERIGRFESELQILNALHLERFAKKSSEMFRTSGTVQKCSKASPSSYLQPGRIKVHMETLFQATVLTCGPMESCGRRFLYDLQCSARKMFHLKCVFMKRVHEASKNFDHA